MMAKMTSWIFISQRVGLKIMTQRSPLSSWTWAPWLHNPNPNANPIPFNDNSHTPNLSWHKLYSRVQSGEDMHTFHDIFIDQSVPGQVHHSLVSHLRVLSRLAWLTKKYGVFSTSLISPLLRRRKYPAHGLVCLYITSIGYNAVSLISMGSPAERDVTQPSR